MLHAESIKHAVDQQLPTHDGFESHMFRIGAYNQAVGEDSVFALPYNDNTMALLLLSTPDMFDVAFRKWVVLKTMEFGSFDDVAELVSSPIQSFLEDRLEVLREKLQKVEENFEILHDYSMTPQRRPKILMQTCGHVAGAAFYYQPRDFQEEGLQWPAAGRMGPNLKFIGLSLHPVYGGHFAFRSVLIFPNVLIPEFQESVPRPILTDAEEVRTALEKFNYNWKDSGFRDFGNPSRRYSTTQMEFFGRPVAERWEVLRPWVEGGAKNID
ncbi:hypothetical protein CAEBREN_24304 [Caenorhabditis brenneri]|uniref:Cyanocobalamin reductase (cyanide-eliminating) n=1 Tax=Caenorhabditis brenneri TaxID=135651 RepID=G0PF90_CAEBE|nr:hypothetical protein CAEBREN_24304 [Caenorhabditis brenneri]